jgi:hypothetical protein
MSSAWFMFGALGAVVASAVESAGKKCGGEFIIQKVSKKYATNKLATLRKRNRQYDGLKKRNRQYDGHKKQNRQCDGLKKKNRQYDGHK